MSGGFLGRLRALDARLCSVWSGLNIGLRLLAYIIFFTLALLIATVIVFHADVDPYDNSTFGRVFWMFFVAGTTIGFGDVTVYTDTGRILVVVCCLPIIALYFATFFTLGQAVVQLYKWSIRSSPALKKYESWTRCIFAATSVCFLVSASAIIMVLQRESPNYQEWNYIGSLYFFFVMCSSIGFGDLIPELDGYLAVVVLLWAIQMALVAATAVSWMEGCPVQQCHAETEMKYLSKEDVEKNEEEKNDEDEKEKNDEDEKKKPLMENEEK